MADTLNQESIPTARGPQWSRTYSGEWTDTTIRSLLVNQVYAGDMIWNRRTDARFHKIQGGCAVERERVHASRLVPNDESDWIIVRDAHPALISRRTSDQAKQKRENQPSSIEQRGRNPRLKTHGKTWSGWRSRFILSGLLTCAKCGSRYQGITQGRGSKLQNGARVVTSPKISERCFIVELRRADLVGSGAGSECVVVQNVEGARGGRPKGRSLPRTVDFFTVPTATFRILFCFVVLRHHRRTVVHFNVTANPTAQWTAQQLIEAFPEQTAPRFLIRDRDSIYGEFFRQRIKNMGIEEVVTAPRAPWQNPFVKRLVGSIRRESLNHVIVLKNERHLRRILRDYFEYYHHARAHLSLDRNSPVAHDVEPPERGKVIAIPHVGGLHQRYRRAA